MKYRFSREAMNAISYRFSRETIRFALFLKNYFLKLAEMVFSIYKNDFDLLPKFWKQVRGIKSFSPVHCRTEGMTIVM